MGRAFIHDTALSPEQIDLIRSRYSQIKDMPFHKTLFEKAVVVLGKQDNGALFLLFDQGFKEFGPLYPLVLVYCLYPYVVTLYSRLGILESIRKATLSDIAIWVKTYEEQNSGNTGLDRYGWICRHLCAKVFRLGRLQFEQGFFEFPYSIYHDTGLLKYRMFAQEGIVCSPDGFMDIGDNSDTESRSTTCSSSHNQLLAHEVDHKTGRISSEVVSVSGSDLKQSCSSGDPVLFVHIPEGEPLTPSLVDDSFSLALSMFNPALFACVSWLLDPELSKLLPSDGNICHFMNRFLKFPVSFSLPQIYERVFGFGATRADILTWECTTSLQRKVQSHIRNGGVFRTMGGYIPVAL